MRSKFGKWFKRILWAAAALGALAAVVLVAAFLYVASGGANGRILAHMEKRVNEAVRGSFTAASIEGNPFRKLTVNGVALTDAEGGRVLEAERLRLTWSLWRFLRTRSGLEAELEGVRVLLTEREGRWNAAELFRAEGKRAAPEPAVFAAHLTLRGAEVEIRRAEGEGKDTTMRARVETLRASVRSRKDSVRVEISEFNGGTDVPGWENFQAAFEMEASPSGEGWDVRVSRASLVSPLFRARLASGKYSTRNGRWKAEVEEYAVEPGAWSLFWPEHPFEADVSGNASLHGDSDMAEFRLSVGTLGGSAEAKGTLRLLARRVEAEGSMKDFSPEAFLGKDFPVSRLTGTFHLAYGWGEGAPWEARLTLASFRHERLRGFPVEAELSMHEGNLRGEAVSREPGLTLNAKFEARPGDAEEPFALDADFEEVTPARLVEGWPETPWTGTLRFNGRGDSPETLEGSGSLRLRATRVADVDMDGAEADFTLREGKFFVKNARVEVAGILYEGEGWTEIFPENPRYALSLNIRSEDGEAWPGLPEGVAFQAAPFHLSLDGRGRAWNAVAEGKASGVHVSGMAAAEVAVRAELSGEETESVRGDVRFDVKEILPNALVGRVEPFDASVEMGITDASLESAKGVFDVRTSGGGESAMSARGEFAWAAHPAAWSVLFETLEIAVAETVWKLENPARMKKEGPDFNVEKFALRGGGGRAVFEGRVSENGGVIRAEAENLDAAAWGRIFFPGEDIGGRVAWKMEIEGAASAPAARGEWSWERPRRGAFDLDGVSGNFSFRNSRLRLAAKGESAEAGALSARGEAGATLSLRPWEAKLLLDAPLSAEIRVAGMQGRALAEFAPWIEGLGGKYSLEADVAGTLRAPVWNGSAVMQGGRLDVPEWGIFLKNLGGAARIRDNVLTLSDFRAEAEGGGHAELHGKMRIRGLNVEEMDIAFAARGLRTLNIPDLEAEVRADLRVTGDAARPVITGTATFSHLVHRPPLLFAMREVWETEDSSIVVLDENGMPEVSPGTEGGWLDRSALDITVSVPATSARLRNREMNIRFGGDLGFRKDPGGLVVVSGQVESRDGWVTFQGRPFRVERGVFTFPGIPVLDPDLDILASYETSDYTAYLKMGGTLSRPLLELYSDPALEAEDVLAVILFGQPASELNEKQQSALSDTGQQMAASFAISGVMQPIADVMKLDVFILRPGSSRDDGGVGAGKYLNDRLYLFYYHRFGNEAAEEFRMRYELRRNLFIETGQDQEGQSGVDIYYSRRY